MRQRRRADWVFGVDQPADRARAVAGMVWTVLHDIDPAKAVEMRDFFTQFGEGYYLGPQWATFAPGQPLTREQVAELAHRSTNAVAMWASRGIVRDNVRYFLRPHDGGMYDPDEVDEFLAHLNTPDGRTNPTAEPNPGESTR